MDRSTSPVRPGPARQGPGRFGLGPEGAPHAARLRQGLLLVARAERPGLDQQGRRRAVGARRQGAERLESSRPHRARAEQTRFPDRRPGVPGFEELAATASGCRRAWSRRPGANRTDVGLSGRCDLERAAGGDPWPPPRLARRAGPTDLRHPFAAPPARRSEQFHGPVNRSRPDLRPDCRAGEDREPARGEPSRPVRGSDSPAIWSEPPRRPARPSGPQAGVF